jgi:hypothetical protein
LNVQRGFSSTVGEVLADELLQILDWNTIANDEPSAATSKGTSFIELAHEMVVQSVSGHRLELQETTKVPGPIKRISFESEK